MKRTITAVLLCLCLCSLAAAQTPDTPSITPLATAIGVGATFNQIGTPRWNIWATAIYPVMSSIGVYASTTTDVIPKLTTDPATQRSYYAFTTSIRQGVHKRVYSNGKFTALLGGDAGLGLNQAAPSGMNVSFAASFTATAVYQINKSWAVAVPIRGLWINSSWNMVPQVGVLFKP